MEFTRPMQFQFPLIRGQDVRAVQQFLTTLGTVPPCGSPDGVFGQQTRASVIAFQQQWNTTRLSGATPLGTTGTVDATTFAALVGAVTSRPAAAPKALTTNTAIPPDLAEDIPLTRIQTVRVKTWMRANFGAAIDAAIAGTSISSDLVCAIAAKESAIFWISFVDRLQASDILRLCVFDASGDFPGTSRSAFPVNAAAMRADHAYADLVDPLIAAANEMRKVLHGWGPAAYLYKGYGIFQYDLQNIRRNDTERAFFAGRSWGNFDACMSRLMREMSEKLTATGGDLEKAVCAYNGSGDRATRYGRSVMVLSAWCQAAQ